MNDTAERQSDAPTFLRRPVNSPEVVAWKLKPDDPNEAARLKTAGWTEASVDDGPTLGNARVGIATIAQPTQQGPRENGAASPTVSTNSSASEE